MGKSAERPVMFSGIVHIFEWFLNKEVGMKREPLYGKEFCFGRKGGF